MNKALISLMMVLLFVMISCGGDDTEDTANNFPNEHDGLNWSDAASSEMTWDEAINYCETLGGRLPTISELRTLIQDCPSTETGGECGVTDECLSWENCWNDSCDGCESDETNPVKYSVFGDTNWFWSSSERSNYTGLAWYVYFPTGLVYEYSKLNHTKVRCVR
ncbi:MAG TPA: DUF1566 domain-containing protein [bacterium]|nr:DUF1566 domain-containing protein [bacterium]